MKNIIIKKYGMKGCASCEEMDEVFSKVLRHHDNIIYQIIDIAVNPELANDANIRNIPTTELYYEGQEFPEYRFVGLADLEYLNKIINQLK